MHILSAKQPSPPYGSRTFSSSQLKLSPLKWSQMQSWLHLELAGKHSSSPPLPPGPPILLSIFVNLTLLGTSCKWCVCVSHSVVSASLQPHGLVAFQAPLSMGFLRQEYWSGLPFPSPGDLPNPGMEPGSPALQADSLPPETLGKCRILQRIFLTQGSNLHLLHLLHWQILYH